MYFFLFFKKESLSFLCILELFNKVLGMINLKIFKKCELFKTHLLNILIRSPFRNKHNYDVLIRVSFCLRKTKHSNPSQGKLFITKRNNRCIYH